MLEQVKSNLLAVLIGRAYQAREATGDVYNGYFVTRLRPQRHEVDQQALRVLEKNKDSRVVLRPAGFKEWDLYIHPSVYHRVNIELGIRQLTRQEEFGAISGQRMYLFIPKKASELENLLIEAESSGVVPKKSTIDALISVMLLAGFIKDEGDQGHTKPLFLNKGEPREGTLYIREAHNVTE